jgi:voltage-gated potassium channel
MRLRQRIYLILERTDHSNPIGKFVNIFLMILIGLNVASVIIETVDEYYQQFGFYFEFIEFISVSIFTIEYFARLWCCVDGNSGEDDYAYRFRYATSPLAIIDLISIAPF